jgi:hypothetical protein
LEAFNFGAWLQDNLLTIVVPSLSGLVVLIVLASVLAVRLKRRKAIKGWQEAIEAVAYVTKTGLTVLYVPYSKGMFEDEQLFGGAMIGVLGILEEITGQRDSQMNIHVMEFGDKRLVIAPSYFGNAILLVNDVKEQHKSRLQEFVRDFELTYKQELTSEGLLNLNEFDEARLLVENYFGVRKEIEDS